MPVVTCAKCEAELDVDPTDVGHLVECPSCRGRFVVPARKARPSDRRSRRDRTDDEPDDVPLPDETLHRARNRLASPGVALQILGWVDVAAGIIGVIIGVGCLIAGATGGGPGSWQMVWLNLGPGLSGVLIGGLKIVGGAAMKAVRNRSLALLAAVAACVPLNVNLCLVWLLFPAYLVGIVFGILALIALADAGVKRAFEVNRPGGDVDAV